MAIKKTPVKKEKVVPTKASAKKKVASKSLVKTGNERARTALGVKKDMGKARTKSKKPSVRKAA